MGYGLPVDPRVVAMKHMKAVCAGLAGLILIGAVCAVVLEQRREGGGIGNDHQLLTDAVSADQGGGAAGASVEGAGTDLQVATETLGINRRAAVTNEDGGPGAPAVVAGGESGGSAFGSDGPTTGDSEGTGPSLPSGTPLAPPPHWSANQTWRVRYTASRTAAERTVYVTYDATYTVVGVGMSDPIGGEAVDIVRLEMPRRSMSESSSYLLVYSANTRSLKRVEYTTRQGAKALLCENDFEEGSYAAPSGSVSNVAIYDWPAFPLAAGRQTFVDPERKKALAVMASSPTPTIVDPGEPGSAWNQCGFHQDVSNTDVPGHTRIVFSRTDPVSGGESQVRIIFDGHPWWREAIVRINGDLIIRGQRL